MCVTWWNVRCCSRSYGRLLDKLNSIKTFAGHHPMFCSVVFPSLFRLQHLAFFFFFFSFDRQRERVICWFMPQMPVTALAGQAEAVACRESTSPLCVLAGSWSQNPSSARTQSLGSIPAAAPRARSCLMLLSNYPCIQFAFRCWKEKNKRVCFRVQS